MVNRWFIYPSSKLEFADRFGPVRTTLDHNPVDDGVQSRPARYFYVRSASEHDI
jgi:hypothetical protein